MKRTKKRDEWWFFFLLFTLITNEVRELSVNKEEQRTKHKYYCCSFPFLHRSLQWNEVKAWMSGKKEERKVKKAKWKEKKRALHLPSFHFTWLFPPFALSFGFLHLNSRVPCNLNAENKGTKGKDISSVVVINLTLTSYVYYQLLLYIPVSIVGRLSVTPYPSLYSIVTRYKIVTT